MDSSDLAAAVAAAQPLVPPDASIVGYWTDGGDVAFAVDPMPIDDMLLVVNANGSAAWEHVGPLAPDGDRYAALVEGEPTPYADPEDLRLVVDALAADEDTPAEVLARAKADLAAAQ